MPRLREGVHENAPFYIFGNNDFSTCILKIYQLLSGAYNF